MAKLKHIIWREFSTRVRKKSFLITTLIGPLVMLVMLIVPYWISSDPSSATSVIAVQDETGLVQSQLQSNAYVQFQNFGTNAPIDGVLIIPKYALNDPASCALTIFNHKNGLSQYIENELNVAFNQLQSDKGRFSIIISQDRSNASQANGVKTFVAYMSAVLIYFFIFLYGIQVMKGVVEEKTNRIVEVLITTVSPFYLMAGKIIGIGLLGLTQFIIWGIVYGLLFTVFTSSFDLSYFNDQNIHQMMNNPSVSPEFAMEMNTLVSTYSSTEWFMLLGLFLFFFTTGYLVFGALFAVIGAASDVDTETQQFIFPLTVPLLTAMILTPQVLLDPTGSTAKVLAFIPYTSPITSVVRNAALIDNLSFYWPQMLLQAVVVIIGFVITTWAAAKVYRIGILSYGQKIGYKQLLRWVFG